MSNDNYSEKVSVNINSSTLSGIDLLVDHGYYSNRSDFINQALRSSLQQHQTTIDRIVAQNTTPARNEDSWFLGVSGLTASDVRYAYNEGTVFSIQGYGILVIENDCPEDMLFAVLKDIRVKGKVICSKTVKEHYGLK